MSKNQHSSSSSDKDSHTSVSSDGKKSRRRRRHEPKSDSCSDQSGGRRSRNGSDVVCLRKFKWHVIKGDKGDSGRKGDCGRRGSRGCKGSPGCKGSTGCKGSRGKRGHRGSEGPPGCKGSRGHAGSRGKRGSTGPPGCKGSRGHRGRKGCDGRGGILGYSFATSTIPEVAVVSGSSVTFNNTDFPSHGVTTNGTLFTLQHGGVYEIDYMIQGVSSDPTLPLQYAVVANSSVVVFGSTFSSPTTGSGIVQGTVLASFPDVAHGVTTGDGTTIELKNMSASTLLTSAGSNSAFLKITRIA